MKKTIFSGAATAVVTPFSNGEVDYTALGGLIEHQISNGISAMVFCGTTGEASALAPSETEEIIRFAVKTVASRVPVIAGCGSNNTAEASRKAKKAEELGADALLCVTPYYNKASVSGLAAHFKAVAGASELPVILYNVPSRTGIDIPLEVYRELAEVENITAVKEASGSVAKSACLLSEFGKRFDVYSGTDEVNLPILSIGGAGVISVLSNVVPAEVSKMCRLAKEEKYIQAAKIASDLYPLTRALFSEVNPIPVKAALSMLGRCKDELRLPLTPLSAGNRARLRDLLLNEFPPLRTNRFEL